MTLARLEIDRNEVYRDGATFGDAGRYRLTEGVAHFDIDPRHPANAGIVDLSGAAGNDGHVHLRASFRMLAPEDLQSGNGRVLQDVPNRGRHLSLGTFNRVNPGTALTDPMNPGDGFLFERGFSLATLGWQPGVRPNEGFWADLPVGFRGEDAVVCHFRPNAGSRTLEMASLGNTIYTPADLSDPRARLIERDYEDGADREIPRAEWRFARETRDGIVSSSAHLYRERGFAAGKIYVLVFYAVDAPVVGAGMLALRDFAARLHDDFEVVHGYGASQTGRLLRHLLHTGLNVSETGRRAFDGMLIHIAGGQRGDFNHRFAQPTLLGPPHHGQKFPFAAHTLDDPLTGGRDGLLANLEPQDVPKIVFTNTSWEYWRGDASLVHIDGVQGRDVPEHPDTRCYAFAGTHHINGSLPQLRSHPLLGFATRYGWNVVDFSPLTRAAFVNLDAWVAGGVTPPASQHPRLDDGTALARADVLESLAEQTGTGGLDPQRLSVVRTIDTGTVPVTEGEVYPCFVSALDDSGNELAGIRLPDVSVPVGFHTGWNPRDARNGAPEQAAIFAGMTRFYDPGEIDRRYSDRASYMRAARAAAQQLVLDGYLLECDVDLVVENSARRYDYALQSDADQSDADQSDSDQSDSDQSDSDRDQLAAGTFADRRRD